MGEIKAVVLDSASNVVSNVNTLFHTGFRKFISLWFKQHESNEVMTTGLNPDRPISNEGYKIDGDLIIVCTWGQGFGIHRVANDGTMTNLFTDTYPINSYAYMNSVAIDTVNKIAVVGSYAQNGIKFYDYSDCFGGGDVVEILDLWNTSNSALTSDEPGMSYINGLGCAGEWFYGSWDEGVTTTVQRWKYHDSDYGATDFEDITIQNRDGSAHRDGSVFEDPVNDRIFIQSYYDGELVVVTGASTATPKAFHIRYDDIPGVGNDGYVHGVIVDKDNPNHLWCGAGYCFFKMDITACVVDGGSSPSPTLIGTIIKREAGATGMMTFSNMRLSAPLGDSSFIKIDADRGWNRRGGWIDTENFMAINISKYEGATQNAGKDWLYYDYEAKSKMISTANGTKYWIRAGYSWDGYNWRTYDEDDIGLYETGEIILGTYTLDNSNNIGTFCWVDMDDYIYAPSGSTITILVSNNNGSSWENYTPGATHTFSTTGNQLQIKVVMTGNGNCCGYLINNAVMALWFAEKTDGDNQERFVASRLIG